MHRSYLLPVEVRSQTWTDLLASERTARRRFANNVESGLEYLGLRVEQTLRVDSNFCSPVNALRFASNGSEAVFSFLIWGGQISDASPIVLTCVGSGEQRNFIVGKSLHDFLCLGYHRGFFALECLSYDSTQTLKRMTTGRWKPKTETDWLTGFGVNDEQCPVLQYLCKRMELRPWRNPSRKFARLQRTYLPHLELRTGLFCAGWAEDEFRTWKKWRDKR